MNISTLPFVTSPPLAPDVTTFGVERFGLSDPQRYAMMQAWASRSQLLGALARKILPHLDEMGCERPSVADWAALRAKRYVTRPAGNRFHDLTPMGLMVATEVGRDFAKKFGEHHYLFRRGAGSGHSGACACGGWNASAPKTWAGEDRLRRGYDLHVARAAADPGYADRSRERVAAIIADVGRQMDEVRHG